MNNEIQEIRDYFTELRNKTHQYGVVGMDDVIDDILITFFSGQNSHLLTEGVPGVGKTLTLSAMARLLNLNFNRIQFKNDLKPKDIIGYLNLENKFVKGQLFANLVLADEINRASPKAQSALLEAMQEGQITTEEIGTQKLEQPYIVVATQNPVERSGGTNPLPEAQQDRFLMKKLVGYPTNEEALAINQMNVEETFQEITPVLDASDILTIRKRILDLVYIDEDIHRKAVRMAELTRPDEFSVAKDLKVRIGSSPRGHISLVKATRVRAVMKGRDYIVPEDLIQLAFPVFFTRVFFTSVNRDDIPKTLKELLRHVFIEGKI